MAMPRLRRSHFHAHDPPLACVTFIFIFFPTDFRAKVETARSLCLQKKKFACRVTSKNSSFFTDLIVMNPFEWIE